MVTDWRELMECERLFVLDGKREEVEETDVFVRETFFVIESVEL